MSKFLLTTHIGKPVHRICQIADKHGIRWHLANHAGLSAYSFEKLCHPHPNYYQSENGDFVIVVGTWIYKKTTGLDAMKQLLSEFSPLKIGQLKKDIVGMWSAVFCKGNTCYVFNDHYGIYDICYSIEGNQICLGTMLHEVALLTDKFEYDEHAFLMEAFQLLTFPHRSIYKGINKLLGKEYCKIEFRENGSIKADVLPLKEEDYAIQYNYTDEITAIADLTALLKDYAAQIDALFGNKGVYMTGGLDSRLVFAAYQAVGADMTFRFGDGGGACAGDILIVEQIAKAYGKELKIFDWSPYPNTQEDDNDVIDLIGYSCWIENGNIRSIRGFAKASEEEPFFAFGYFCEAIRLREWAETKGKFFSLDDYVDNYYLKGVVRDLYKDYDGYRQFVYEGHKKQLNGIGYKGDINRIPIDIFERFRWEMARFGDSRMEFMLNVFSYGFSLLSVPAIHELILSLPADVIRDAKFQLKVIANINRELLDFDVFSHRRPYVVTKNLKKKRKMSVKTMGDYLFTLMPFIKPMATRLYKKKRYGMDAQRKKVLDAVGDEIPAWLDVSKFNGFWPRLNGLLKCQRYLRKERNLNI